jgi:hypothetical protein
MSSPPIPDSHSNRPKEEDIQSMLNIREFGAIGEKVLLFGSMWEIIFVSSTTAKFVCPFVH